MHNYRYVAKNDLGKTVRGQCQASDEADLYRRLREEGNYLVKSRQLDKSRGISRRLPLPQISDFCQQLGTLLSAGVTLVRALSILSAEEDLKPRQKALYERMLTDIRQGTPLSTAMENQGDAFPPLMINMFRASENTGNIDKTAMRMANHYDKEYKLTQKVKSAMTYPMVVLVLAVLVLVFVMAFIIPQFEPLFAQLTVLPLPTRIIMGLSDLVTLRWPYLITGMVILIALVQTLKQIPAVRLWLDKRKLHLPIIGKLLSTIYTARFARTLSSLYSSGMPIVASLQVGRTTVGNTYIASQFDLAIEQVRRGTPLSKALEGVDGLRKKLHSAIYVGEETGSLDHMLSTIADGMDYEADLSIQKLVSLLEPFMLILMAAMVGFVIIAVMLPIFETYSVYGNDIV